MSDLVFTTRGVAELLDAQEKLAAAIGKPKTAAMQLQQEFRANQTEIKNLERIAKQVMRDVETGEEKYTRKLGEAKTALQGKAGAVEKLAIYEKKLRDEMETQATSTKKAGDAWSGGFGPEKLAAYIAGFASLGGAVSAVNAYLADMVAKSQAAAAATLNAVGGLGELQQVAQSPADYRKLAGQARSMVAAGIFGPGNETQAADLTFALRNAGYSDSDVGFITQLGANKQVRPENLQRTAEGLKKYQAIYGEKEAGKIPDIAAKVWAAAGRMQTDFSKTAEASTLFGSEAASLGYTDEESLAAFASIEQRSPGTEEAATRLRALLSHIAKDPTNLNKGSLKSSIAAMRDRMAKGETAIGITGEVRAAAGLNILAEQGGWNTFLQGEREIASAPQRGVIGRSRFIDSDPRLHAAIMEQQAAGKLDQGRNERLSELQSYYNTYRDELVNKFESQGRYKASYAQRGYLWMQEHNPFGSQRQTLQEEAFSSNDHMSPELRSDTQNYLIRTANSPEEKSKLQELQKTTNSLLQQQLNSQNETNRILRTKPPMTWGPK